MKKQMATFVMRRIGEVGMMDKPVPEPGLDGAVVRTTAALICTSDTHTWPARSATGRTGRWGTRR